MTISRILQSILKGLVLSPGVVDGNPSTSNFSSRVVTSIVQNPGKTVNPVVLPQPTVSLVLYLESACPFCQNFVTEDLPTVLDDPELSKLVNFDFVPWGNAYFETEQCGRGNIFPSGIQQYDGGQAMCWSMHCLANELECTRTTTQIQTKKLWDHAQSSIQEQLLLKKHNLQQEAYALESGAPKSGSKDNLQYDLRSNSGLVSTEGEADPRLQASVTGNGVTTVLQSAGGNLQTPRGNSHTTGSAILTTSIVPEEVLTFVPSIDKPNCRPLINGTPVPEWCFKTKKAIYQHGTSEGAMDVYQSCAKQVDKEKYADFPRAVKFVRCAELGMSRMNDLEMIELGVSDIVEHCAQQAGFKAYERKQIFDCRKQPNSFKAVEVENAKRTPQHPGVPFILLDGEDIVSIWEGSLKETVCMALMKKIKKEALQGLTTQSVVGTATDATTMSCSEDVLMFERSGLRRMGSLWKKARGLFTDTPMFMEKAVRRPTIWEWFTRYP